MNTERADEVGRVLDELSGWAGERDEIVAVALVGSWARGDADEDSDVDVILFVEDPAKTLAERPWLELFGDAEEVGNNDRGALTESRIQLGSGLELEIGVTTPAWASTDPLDPGTERVVRDGFRALYDPNGILDGLGSLEGGVSS